MASRAATINTKVDEAVTAQEAGDFATALSKLRSAAMLIAAIPDQSSESERLEWDHESIRKMIVELEKAQTSQSVASAGGPRTSKITWGQPTA